MSHWADKIAKEIVDSGKYLPYWVDDMKTPSGFAHVGSLMGPVLHSIVFRALKDQGLDTSFTFVINNFDPVDGLSEDLKKDYGKYMGFPLRLAPSPDPKFESMADYYANDFVNSIKSLGVEAKILSSWDMYKEGKFDEVIKVALDNAEKIQDIYKKVSGSTKKEQGWLPFQVICENCGKLGTTKVFAWDGKEVSYRCEPSMVEWAQGCGHEGKIRPFGGTGKLPWKVDWAAHWKVIGITIEGAGKDHASAGGSYDIAMTIVKEVFGYDRPYKMPYEFILIGGRKMSSSKGLGLKAHDLTGIMPGELGRFLYARADLKKQSNFDPVGTTAIPDLFDDYDKCWTAYNSDGDESLSRKFELSQLKDLPEKNKDLFLPRFREVANFIQQPNVDLNKKFEEEKGSTLTANEKEILEVRIKYAKIWLEKYASKEDVAAIAETLPNEVTNFSSQQKEYLVEVVKMLENTKDPEKLQLDLYNKSKEMNIPTKDAFSAIYLSLIGRPNGPKAAWFLLSLPKEKIKERFKEAVQSKIEKKSTNRTVNKVSDSEYFSIEPSLKTKYPTISVGVAIIKDVNISKNSPELEKEKSNLLNELKDLTTEELGSFSEMQSYRKLYREMGVDWHSKRPSPEALLRRVALGKGLYNINTCVDAYNLVVMKNKVSVGAFDAENIKFPTTLRLANEGDIILLLGDEKPTEYTSKELAYYDQEGGYNIDYNYRDAQRTMITEKTKNILINVDGVYDVTPDKVEKTLDEAIEKIIKYCGGRLTFKEIFQ